MGNGSFVLYADAYESMRSLADAQKGKLLDAIFLYHLGEQIPEMDAVVAMAFSFMRRTFDRDSAKYNERCEKARKSANMRWHANACEGKQVDANACEGIFENAKPCYTVPVSVPVPVPGSGIEKDKKTGAVDGPQQNFSGFAIYHADGVMSITDKTYSDWEKAYPLIDLPAELQRLSDWSRETREWSKASAFFACSSALAKRNEAIRQKRIKAEAEEDARREDFWAGVL